MKTAANIEKLKKLRSQTLYPLLSENEQQFIDSLSDNYLFTFQEFRQICEYSRDLTMWGENSLQEWWAEHANGFSKKQALDDLNKFMSGLSSQAKDYKNVTLERPKKREKGKIAVEKSEKNVFGNCPVYSDKTVCCNLKTIDAVENCIFGCSYCTIQTFYKEQTIFDADLPEKLSKIKLDPNKYHHIGTGQSSDSLAWGNKNGNLDALCNFARNNPNALLEFKTKSNNIRYFLENDIPPNIVCSWSLNPQVIIENEEHFTASLNQRLSAARAVADKGVKVSFHFHPIVYYSDWKKDYPDISRNVRERFDPKEVLFISFGSVTFIKPVLKKIRKQGFATKITQMELVSDPHGKLTYPDHIKIEKFSTMYQTFSPWHGKVFFYLCMEKADLWTQSFGYVYPDNAAFEKDMLEQCFLKIR